MNTRNWQFWNVKNMPSPDNNGMKVTYDEATNEVVFVNVETSGIVARLYIVPSPIAMGKYIAELMLEAQRAGYLQAQRDMREAMGIRQ